MTQEPPASAPDGGTGTLTVYLHLSPFVMRMQALMHMTPGVVLFLTGVSDLLGGEAHGIVTVLGILAGGAVTFSAVRQMLSHRATAHAGIHWLDIFVGLMLFMEAVHRYKPDKGFQVAWAYMFAGALTLLVGLLHGRLARNRFVRFTQDDIIVRTRVLSSGTTLPWRELVAVNAGPGDMLIMTTRTGVRRFSLGRYANRGEVFAAVDRFRHRIPAADDAPPAEPAAVSR
jgi:hypothetical protein